VSDAGIKLEPQIIVGIPAFNEEKTIASVVLGAQKHAHIVLVCDDGSKDMTAEIAERLGAVVVRHEKNRGYGAALQSLFKRANELNADIFITLDSDGQHDPSEIPDLVKPIEDGVADVVLGSRFMGKTGTADMPKYRKFGIQVITKLANGSSKNTISDSQSGFRAYNKVAIEKLGSFSDDGMGASLELVRAITRSGLSVYEVPISCKYASSIGAETSTKNPLRHGLSLITSIVQLIVEDRPLMLLGVPGIISLVVGSLFGVWMLNLYAEESRIVTNVALASIGFLFLGCFLISTAITLYAITRVSKKINR
jgi:glycosyltransferase involved in cell wall biosynthesis